MTGSGQTAAEMHRIESSVPERRSSMARIIADIEHALPIFAACAKR